MEERHWVQIYGAGIPSMKSQVPICYFTSFHEKLMVGTGLKYTHQSRLGSIWTNLVPEKK